MTVQARLISELADGAAPGTSRAHWRCAEQLLEPNRRRELAAGLERLVDQAERPGGGLSAAIPPQRRQVRDARTALLELAAALRSPEPVAVEAVAIVARVLTDVAGPVYAPWPAGALAELARRALTLLARLPTTSDLAPTLVVAPPTGRERILFVSRSQGLARALAISLRRRGYELESATGVAAAAGALDVRSFGVVVIDLDGVRGRVGDLGRLRQITKAPMLAFVASLADGEPARALDAGADEILQAPYALDDLVRRLDALVGHQARRESHLALDRRAQPPM